MGVDRASFLIIDLWDPLRLYYLIWTALFAVSLLLLLIINSRFGVILQGIKDNESRIEAMGLGAEARPPHGHIHAAARRVGEPLQPAGSRVAVAGGVEGAPRGQSLSWHGLPGKRFAGQSQQGELELWWGSATLSRTNSKPPV